MVICSSKVIEYYAASMHVAEECCLPLCMSESTLSTVKCGVILYAIAYCLQMARVRFFRSFRDRENPCDKMCRTGMVSTVTYNGSLTGRSVT
jgi:hypothetical protein